MGEERAGGDACPFALAPQFLVVWGCAGGDVLEASLEIGGGARRPMLRVNGVIVHGRTKFDFASDSCCYKKSRAPVLRD